MKEFFNKHWNDPTTLKVFLAAAVINAGIGINAYLSNDEIIEPDNFEPEITEQMPTPPAPSGPEIVLKDQLPPTKPHDAQENGPSATDAFERDITTYKPYNNDPPRPASGGCDSCGSGSRGGPGSGPGGMSAGPAI